MLRKTIRLSVKISILVFISFFILSFQKGKELKLTVSVKDGKTKLDNVSAVLYESDMQMAKGKLIKTHKVNAGTVVLNLELKKQFLIEFKKEDYVSQLVFVNTNARDEEIKAGTTDAADLDVDMFRYIEGLNITPIQNKPSIKFRFIKDEGQFDTDRKYDEIMEPVLEKIKAQLVDIKQKGVYRNNQNGYEFFKKKQYEEALLCYLKALEYYADDKVTLKRIAEVEKKMTKEQAFQKFKKDGDDALTAKYIDNALKAYKKALKLKPGDGYVTGQVEKCKNGTALAQNTQDDKKNADKKKKEDEELKAKNKAEEEAKKQKELAEAKATETENKKEQDSKKDIAQNNPINENKQEQLTTTENNNAEENKNDLPENKDAQETRQIKEDTRSAQQKIDSSLAEISKIAASGDKASLALAYSDLAELYYDNGETNNALDYYEQTLEQKEASGDKMGVSVALMNMGVIYLNTYRLDEALKFFNKSLKIKQDIVDKPGESKVLYRVGNVYYEQKDFAKAAEYFEKSLEIDKTLKNDKDIAASFNNLGVMYYQLRNYQKAMEYYEKAYKMDEKSGYEKEMSIALNNMGNINFDWSKYKEALDFYEKSLNLKEKIDYQKGIAISLFNIGNVYQKLNNASKAKDYYTKSIKISKNKNFNDLLYSVYIALSDLYNLQKDCQASYDSYKNAVNYKAFAPVSVGRQFSEMHFKFEAESLRKTEEITMLKEEVARQKLYAQTIRIKKELEITEKNAELSRIEADMNFQRLLKYTFFIGFFLVLILAAVLYRGYKQKKKQRDEIEKKNQALEHANFEISEKNEELNQQKEEITSQRDEIEAQRDQIILQKQEITDSIYYAQYIQKALMRPEEGIMSMLPENFILFLPRNIVSGDFYWMGKKGDNIIVIAADCTGHGVPGAFMSMLGIALLNEIVSRMPDPEPGAILPANEILNQLRDNVIKSLHQTGKEGESKDGMDVALCVINKNIGKLNFAGAFNPLYHVPSSMAASSHGTIVHEIKGDRMPIGIFISENIPFKNHELKIEKGDTVYIFSDGFADQFGGPKCKKMSHAYFRQSLLDVQNLPMCEQKEKLLQVHNEWKGDNEQIDDILLIGLRF